MNSTSHHALAVIATFVTGAATASLHAAAFSDDNCRYVPFLVSVRNPFAGASPP